MFINRWFYLISFVIFCIGYFCRFQLENNFPNIANKRIKITAAIAENPRLKINSQTFKVGNVRIQTDNLEEYQYGDWVVVVGKAEKRVINRFYSQIWLINPEIKKLNKEELGTKDRRKKIKYSKRLESLKICFFKKIYSLRIKINQVYKRTLPEPQASLLSGIVIGTREKMPFDFYQALKQTGTLHIIAASGMNISLLIGSLINPLTWIFKRKQAIIVGFFGILIYCLIAGAGPAVIRAGVMGGISYLAVFLGREHDGLIALLVTAAIMLLINPFLIFDVGFQLSFSAMLGMIFLIPYLKKLKILKNRFFQALGNEFLETLAAILATAPILIINFGQFNPLSIIPNQFVIFLVPYLMVFGAVQAGLGLILLPLGQIIALLTFLPLTYFVGVIKLFGKFSFLNLSFSKLGPWFVIGYYLILAFILLFHKYKTIDQP